MSIHYNGQEIAGAFSGKSAYQQALDGGYIGTEDDYNIASAKVMQNADSIDGLTDKLAAINTSLNNKSNKSIQVSATLVAASWACTNGRSAPYGQSISVTGVTITSVNEILPSLTITYAQLIALQSANIVDGGQAIDSITLIAQGDKPVIDIPIRVIIRGDL